MRVEQEFMRRKEEEKRTKRITIDLDSREIITAPSADVIKEDWRRTHRKQTTGGGSIAAVLGEENDHVPVYRRSFPTDAHQTAANQRAPTNAVIGVLQDDAFIK
jgi:hypothetical protein